MIYLVMNDYAVQKEGIPKCISFSATSIEEMRSPRYKIISMADFAFTFEGGKTVYHKNRSGMLSMGYQFTDEERTWITSSAVPLEKS